MISTYLLPVCDGKDIWIDKVFANNLKSAEDKFIDDWMESTQLDDISDWDELKERLLDKMGIIIGDIYDSEEF